MAQKNNIKVKWGNKDIAIPYDPAYFAMSNDNMIQYIYALEFTDFEELYNKYLYWHQYPKGCRMTEIEYCRKIKERLRNIYEKICEAKEAIKK